jgi:hypothetical protein
MYFTIKSNCLELFTWNFGIKKIIWAYDVVNWLRFSLGFPDATFAPASYRVERTYPCQIKKGGNRRGRPVPPFKMLHRDHLKSGIRVMQPADEK